MQPWSTKTLLRRLAEYLTDGTDLEVEDVLLGIVPAAFAEMDVRALVDRLKNSVLVEEMAKR